MLDIQPGIRSIGKPCSWVGSISTASFQAGHAVWIEVELESPLSTRCF